MAGKVSKKKKVKKYVEDVIFHINATFNNTHINVTDLQGNTLTWSSGGLKGYKGTKKGTPHAAQVAAEDAALKAKSLGAKRAIIYVKGPGAGREAAIRAIQGTGIKIVMIRDVTPIPHNGCRPPKRRRV
jgi:small subunit ribosomal protein S11